MRVFTRLLVAAMLAIPLVPAPALAQREVTDAPDPYVDSVTGIAFPEEIEGLRRIEAKKSGRQGDSTSVVYRVLEAKALLGLLLLPGEGGTCAEWFESNHAAEMTKQGVARETDVAPSLLLPDNAFQQFSATYSVQPGALGAVHPELVIRLLVACPVTPGKGAPDWVVKYRGIFQKGDALDMEGLAERLFTTIDWSPLTGK